MKRAVIIVAVLLLAISSLAIVGCGGGDTETAKKYMKTADDAATALETKSEEILNQAMEVVMPLMSGDLSGVDAETLPALNAELSELSGEADTVKADYEKITTLEGVPDYVEYANVMIEWTDIFKETVVAGQEMFEQLVPIIDEALKTGDTTNVMSALTSLSGDSTTIQEDLEKKKKEADKIKKDKNLSD